MNSTIPYKIYLSEEEMPKYWYNVKARMKTQHPPFLNPATMQPCTKADLQSVFCDECIDQELNEKDEWIEIPADIRNFIKHFAPRPWCARIFWNACSIRLRKFIINSRATTLPVRIN